MNKDVERLVQEWLDHSNIVLAVDYDDTIFHWRHRSEEECKETLRLVKWVKSIGAHVMIHSSSNDDRHDEIRDYCTLHGLKVSSINENPIDLPYGREGKPYYNWQLCDRSGLAYAMEVLEEAAKIVLSKKKNDEILNEVG